MDRFTKKILAYIRKEALIPRGSIVVSGFSGGADSVCLLCVLKELEKVLGFRVEAVHVNHQLRGEEALRDEEFCRRFCRERGIPFSAVRVDVRKYAREKGLSVEEAGRELRYRVLTEAAEAAGAAETAETAGAADRTGRAEETAERGTPEQRTEETAEPGTAELRAAERGTAEQGTAEEGTTEKTAGGKTRIAVAHHADDQAETVLFNLIRGTGLRGMSGMSSRRGDLIRPLLAVQKEEILDWIRERNLPFVTDSSNTDTAYTRNRIRLEVIPVLKSINSRSAEHLLRAAETAAEADAYLRAEAVRICDLCAVPGPEDGIGLKRKILKDYPQILRRYVIIETLLRIGVPMKDWGEIHLETLDRLLAAPAGTRAEQLPGSVSAENVSDRTVIRYSRKA